MKAGILFTFILVFLVASTSHAALYDNWHLIGDNFTVDNINYVLEGASEDRTTVILKANASFGVLILKLNDTIVKEAYDYSYNDSRPNSTYKDSSYDMTDPHFVKEPFRFRIIINKYKPTLKVTRECENEVFFGDTLSVQTTLQNTGTSDLTVKYDEPIPIYYQFDGEIDVVSDDYSGKRKSKLPNRVAWTGKIEKGKSVYLNYNYKLVGWQDGTDNVSLYAGNASYNYQNVEYSTLAPIKKVSLKKPFGCTFSLKKDTLNIGDSTELSLNVANLYASSVKTTLKIYIPNTLGVSDFDKPLSFANDYYEWSGHISTDKEFAFEFLANESGRDNITLVAAYEYNGYKGVQNCSKEVKVNVDPIKFWFHVNASQVKSYDYYRMNYSFQNPLKKGQYYDLEVNIDSDLFPKKTYRYPVVEPQKFVASEPIVEMAPWIYDHKMYKIRFFGTYKTKYNEVVPFSINTSIIIKPIEVEKEVQLQDIVVNSTNESLELKANITWPYDNASVGDVVVIFRSKNGTKIGEVRLSKEDVKTLNEQKSFMVTLLAAGGIHDASKEVEVETQFSIQNITYYSKKFQKYISKIPGQTSTNQTTMAVNITTGEKQQKTLFESYFSNKKPLKLINVGPLALVVIISVASLLIFGGIYLYYVAKSSKNANKGGVEQESTLEKSLHDTEIKIIDEPEEQQTGQVQESFKSNVSEIKIPELKEGKVPNPDYNFDRLQRFIQNCRANGMDREQIRKSLLDKGWLPEVVDVYLK
ncbi:MAG: hypothetical protein QXK37_04830 [Candidatus Woesearchaeota archaeon]